MIGLATGLVMLLSAVPTGVANLSVPAQAFAAQVSSDSVDASSTPDASAATSTAPAMSATEQHVRDYFTKRGIPELIAVAQCESSFRHTLKDGSVLRGTVDPRDVGVMQINTYYQGPTAEKLGLDLMNIDDNMAFAAYLYKKDGLADWNASKPCWKKPVHIIHLTAAANAAALASSQLAQAN